MSEPMMGAERALDEFLREPQGGREDFLAMRPPLMRKSIFQSWANSERLRLDDVLGLDLNMRSEMMPYLIGSQKLAIRAVDRTFNIGLAGSKSSAVKIENGTQGKRRLYITIDKPKPMGVRSAINALLQYGQHAETLEQRGKLKELSDEDFGEYFAAKKAKKKPPVNE